MRPRNDPTEPSPPRCPHGHGAIGAGTLAGLCKRCLLDPDLPEDDAEDEPSLPTRFGDYELLAKLGEGGMGVVYKARQVSLDRIVALKRIRDGELAGADARRRFLDDAKAAAQLDHPHIVPIYDVGEHDGQLYFTMKLMSGGTLRKAAARFAEARSAAALVATLARAAHACHLGRIVHRDLKPENILFDDHDEPYVADFGVAKHLEIDGGSSTNAVVGTVHYMAPERARGHAKRATVAVDVWSLGVILYELLVGRPPFSGPTALEVLRRVVEDEPEPLDRLRRDVGRDLATVCLTCLHKEPERRYISAEALADDLDRCLRGQAPEARRPGRITRAARWCQRHKGPTALFGSAALALVTLTLWALAGARAQERARRDEVLATNVYAARAVAGTVLAQLDVYAGWVEKQARDPRLVAAFAAGDDEALRALCEALHTGHGGDASPIARWFIVDPGGRLRAHFPPGRFGRAYYLDLALRDYYRGATALPAGADRSVYVSSAYRGTSDDRYKIAIASPIRSEDGVIAGVIVAAIATDRQFGALKLSDERRIAVLTVRRAREVDAEALPSEHILLVHDGVEHGEGVVVESAALRRLTARRDAAGTAGHEPLRLPPREWVEAEDDYQDPLAERDPEGARGPWLAGIAPVGHTELTVIVQTRVDDATALDRPQLRVLVAWSVGGAALLVAAFFAALRTARRRLPTAGAPPSPSRPHKNWSDPRNLSASAGSLRPATMNRQGDPPP